MEEKKKNDKRLMTVILAIALIAFAVVRFFFRDEGSKVVVTVDGKEYGTYSLYKEVSFDVINEYGTNTIVIAGGKVDVIFADCPDQICADYVPISMTNETIVCLPHKLVVEIKSDKENDIDGAVK